MQKIAILFLLLAFYTQVSADEAASSSKLRTIEVQISALESLKSALKEQMQAADKQEMALEMQGQQEIIDQNWHAASQTLKAAEASQQRAATKLKEMEEIELQLKKLAAEKNALINEGK